MPDRLAEWAAVLAPPPVGRRSKAGCGSTSGADVDLGELGRLVGAEQRCSRSSPSPCPSTPTGTALEVRAPEQAAE